jgi:hypothetical protein
MAAHPLSCRKYKQSLYLQRKKRLRGGNESTIVAVLGMAILPLPTTTKKCGILYLLLIHVLSGTTFEDSAEKRCEPLLQKKYPSRGTIL